MKEKYLIDIKNEMFWHFSSSEIKDTLEELNTHFETAHSNGISEEEVINEYGKPEIVAKELRDEINPIERKRKKAAVGKGILYVLCIFAIYIIFSIFELNTSVGILIAIFPVLLWLLSGNNCMIGILSKTKEKYNFFIKNQGAIFLLVIFLHLFSLIIVPYIISAGYNTFFFKNIVLFIYFAIGSLCLITVFYLWKMFQGNLYMFFLTVQNVSIIIGLFMYIYFLKNIETTDNIKFVFTQYFICLPILFFYWVYIYKIERGKKFGCSD